MPAGKHDRLIIRRAQAANDAIGAGADLGWLLTVRAPVAEQKPAGSVGEDFAALAPLVVAVVPFEQVRIKLGGVAKPSQRAGASRTLKGTGENPIKLEPLKALVEPSGFAFALFRQRNIRASGMLTACAPFGFAMADEIDARKHSESNPQLRRPWGPADGDILPRPALLWICDQRTFGHREGLFAYREFLDRRPKGNSSDDNQRRKSDLVNLALAADTASEVGVGRTDEQQVIDNGELARSKFRTDIQRATICVLIDRVRLARGSSATLNKIQFMRLMNFNYM